MTVTNYIWDVENDSYLMETDENNSTMAVFTNEPVHFGSLISQRRGSTTSTFIFDSLGSTRELSDGNETVTDTYIYSGFGETITETGTTTNPFRFVGLSGYYFDEGTGKYYIRARMYDPSVARWLSEDPFEFADDPNRYLYVSNEPIQGVDPSGLFSLSDARKKCCKERCDKKHRNSPSRARCKIRCLNSVGDTVLSDEELFECWYQMEKADLMNWYRINDNDWPACPCSLKCKQVQVRVHPTGIVYFVTVTVWSHDDPHFSQPSGLWNPKYHPGAKREIRSKKPIDSTGAGEQCTYDEEGKLITKPLGAGSVDRFSPSNAWLFGYSPSHISHDVKPWDLARKLDNIPFGENRLGEHLRKYSEVRPTNNKKNCPANPAG